MAIIGKTRTNQPVESVDGASLGTKLYRHYFSVSLTYSGSECTGNIEIISTSKDEIKAMSSIGTYVNGKSYFNYQGSQKPFAGLLIDTIPFLSLKATYGGSDYSLTKTTDDEVSEL